MSDFSRPAPMPPPPHRYAKAAAKALEAVRSQPDEQLEWLGACRQGDGWVLPVLDDLLRLDLRDGALRTRAGQAVGAGWQVLTLHYLGVSARPEPAVPAVTFAGLPDAHAFAPVYQRRVTDRLCGTVGRTEQGLRRAAAALGAQPAPGGDLGLDFPVYSRIPLRLLWYAGDDELAPSAVLLLPGHIESFFCLEDIAVLSEGLVSRLAGTGF